MRTPVQIGTESEAQQLPGLVLVKSRTGDSFAPGNDSPWFLAQPSKFLVLCLGPYLDWMANFFAKKVSFSAWFLPTVNQEGPTTSFYFVLFKSITLSINHTHTHTHTILFSFPFLPSSLPPPLPSFLPPSVPPSLFLCFF